MTPAAKPATRAKIDELLSGWAEQLEEMGGYPAIVVAIVPSQGGRPALVDVMCGASFTEDEAIGVLRMALARLEARG